MSKQSELLEILGRYVDGLPVNDLTKKLPAAWFNTLEHAKEVRNCLHQLKLKNQVQPHDPTGQAVAYWRVMPAASAEPAKEPETLPIEPADVAVVAEALSGGMAVEFIATDAAPDDRYEFPGTELIERLLALPAGVQRKTVEVFETEDGQRFDTAADAVAHLRQLELRSHIDAFLAQYPAGDGHQHTIQAALLNWEAWRNAWANRGAPR